MAAGCMPMNWTDRDGHPIPAGLRCRADNKARKRGGTLWEWVLPANTGAAQNLVGAGLPCDRARSGRNPVYAG